MSRAAYRSLSRNDRCPGPAASAFNTTNIIIVMIFGNGSSPDTRHLEHDLVELASTSWRRGLNQVVLRQTLTEPSNETRQPTRPDMQRLNEVSEGGCTFQENCRDIEIQVDYTINMIDLMINQVGLQSLRTDQAT
jgi:hypothetical protein